MKLGKVIICTNFVLSPKYNLCPYLALLAYICDIPWYRAFPRKTCIINISMYFGATEKWHVQMVMVSRVVQLAGASDVPPGTRVSNRPVYAVISVMPDV